MVFNLFGPIQKKDIRVGYISTDRGYVSGITIYEANKYAFKNPGTTFILETRDSTRYLNINDVNKLSVEDIIPKKNSADGTCPGVVGFTPQESLNDTIGTGGPGNTLDPRSVLPRGPLGPIVPPNPSNNNTAGSQPTGSQNTQTNVPDGSPLVVISGCGGVGAKAIPVIGNDGGILDIVVTSGGFGYKCPPQVTVIDPNRIGSGVVATSTIGVTTSPSLLTYTEEDDFELYNFDPTNGDPDLPGYGNRTNPDGENIGGWDPTLYATFAKDPIAVEIEKYQKFLKQLRNPWWSTRKEAPLNISFGNRRSKVKHDVEHPAWEKEFMNKYAISPVPPSNVGGSDFAGRWCTFEWEENFPYSGEYVFRGMADNIGKMYLDNDMIMKVNKFRGGATVVKKTVEEGVHRIKVDLFNIPIKELVKSTPGKKGCPSNIDFRITTSADFANGIRIPGLNIDIKKEFKGSQLNESFQREVQRGVEYDVFITSPQSKRIQIRTKGESVLQVEEATDNDWQDLVCTVSCGRFIKLRGNRCKLIFDAPSSPELPPSKQNQTDVNIFNTTDFIDKADRKLWRTNLYNNPGFLNEYGVCPFNTITKLNEDYDGTHVIRWENITFPADGNYKIEVEVDDSVKLFIGNRSGEGAMKIGNGLRSVEDGGDEVIIEKKGFVGDSSKGTGKSTYSRFFRKGQYRIRAELFQKPGGDFGFEGVINKNPTSPPPNKTVATAKFVRRGRENYLKVEGSGSVEISFRLKVIDDPRTTETFASKVKIGKGPNNFIELKRSKGVEDVDRGQFKERETITGSAFFEAGREYLIKRIGSSQGNEGGIDSVRIDNNGERIRYNEDLGDGYELNGDLIITKVKGTKVEVQPAPVRGLNPMALAVRITSDIVEETFRISPKTWNENPMGAAFTIEAPMPPIPISPRTFSEGRCPENPTWTTRFSGGQEKWWPVTHRYGDGSRSWSKFMNRFAISPIPPLGIVNSDGGGIVYSNSWEINIPHSGFYALKGTVDNGGRILVDDVERMRGGYFPGAVFSAPTDVPQGKLAGFRTQSPPLHKFYLEEGQHKITVEVENQKTLKQKKVEKKIFSTKDWRNNKTNTGKVEINFKVTTDADFANSIKFGTGSGKEGFSFGKSYKGPQINESTTKVLEGGKVYDVVFDSNRKGGGSKGYSIEYDFADAKSFGLRVRDNGRIIQYDDDASNGFDINGELKIMSSSPGVNAKFSDDGKELVVKGSGDVTIRYEWDDKPSIAGVVFKSLTLGGKTWRQEGTKGQVTKTIKVENSVRGSKPNIRLRNAGENVVQMEEYTDNDWQDLVVTASKGRFFDFNGRKCKFVVGAPIKDVRKVQDGVTYNGPRLFVIKSGSAVTVWSKYMQNNAVSPFIPPIDKSNDAIVGDRTYIWNNVNFFESGRYKFLFQSDDNAILYINGSKILESRSFRGDPIPSYAEISAGKYEVKVVCNNINLSPNVLAGNNPTGFALDIKKDVIVSETSAPWTDNPVGISAILIPPPCPKVIEGKGIVIDIDVKSPGNGFPPVPQGGVPTVVTVKDIEPTLPGINYDPDDKAIINDIPVAITVDNFGRVTNIKPPEPIVVTDTPVVEIPSLTGAGFRGTPIMQTTIVPEEVFDDADIIQVTDLVGLKQNGYVNGKPYYGSVFSKNGELFAGIVETTGVLVPVYATLQESIDNRVTTRPSAILRQGTDINSNNPRLNIPGTPENLI